MLRSLPVATLISLCLTTGCSSELLDQRSSGKSAEESDNAVALAAQTAQPSEVLVTTTSAQFSTRGSWKVSSLPGQDGGKTLYANNLAANEASWLIEAVPAVYEVSVNVIRHANSTAAATYEVRSQSGTKQIEVDFKHGDSGWMSLGLYYLVGAQQGVTLKPSEIDQGFLRAAEVRYKPLSEEAVAAMLPTAPYHADVLVTTRSPSFSTKGVWYNSSLLDDAGRPTLYAPSTPEAEATWTLDAPTGVYEVLVHAMRHSNSVSLTTVKVHHAGGVTDFGIDLRQGNSEWTSLGEHQLSGPSRVVLTQSGRSDLLPGNLRAAEVLFRAKAGICADCGPPSAEKRCPTGFVKVAARPELQVPEFCVMKYEAKVLGDDVGDKPAHWGVPESRAAGTPWVRISRAMAESYCANMSVIGGRLTSPEERQAVAKDIGEHPANTITLHNQSSIFNLPRPQLNIGHIIPYPDAALAASPNDQDFYFGLSRESYYSTPLEARKRTHMLRSGGVIWDFGGNVAELALGVDLIYGGSWSGAQNFKQFPADPAPISGPVAQWFYSEDNALLGARYTDTSSSANYAVGFRCAADPF